MTLHDALVYAGFGLIGLQIAGLFLIFGFAALVGGRSKISLDFTPTLVGIVLLLVSLVVP